MFGCGGREEASSASSNKSIEHKLAEVNKGGYVSEEDISVNRFRFLLTQLSDRLPESREKIADISVYGQNDLRKIGVAESLLNIMEGMYQATIFVKPKTQGEYAEWIAAYLTVREQGLSHDEAVDGLAKMFPAIRSKISKK
jgi:hypothetical protein